MIQFSVFNPDTGALVANFTVATEDEVAANTPAGHTVFEGHAPSDHFLKDGQLVPYPPKPGPWARFDLASESWIDPRSPAEKAETEKRAFKVRRDVAIVSGTIFAGMALPTDEATQSRITGAALAAMIDPTYSVQWKLPDGSFVLLDAQQVIAVAQAIRAHVQACFDREAALLEALSEGQPYDIEAGWPAV